MKIGGFFLVLWIAAAVSNEAQTKRVSFESGYRMVCTFTMLVLPWVLSGMPAVITTVSPECR